MQFIILRVRQRGHVLTLLSAIITAFLVHICCIGPLLLVPLGLGGVSVVLEKTITGLRPWIFLVPIVLMCFTGWKIYSNPRTQLIEKVLFWLSVGVVTLMLIL